MNKGILGSAMAACLICGAVVGLVMLANMNPTQIVETIGQRGWTNLATAMGDPGAGSGGVMQLCIYPHQAAPGAAYAANLSNATAYAHSDNLNAACIGDVPYDTTFDIVYTVRYNASQAYNSTGAVWMNSWIRGNITCANLAIGADSAMTLVNINNGSSTGYMYVNYYVNNGGAGYTITHGQQVNITSFKMQYYG